ncbi:MAG: SMI1/KNR4 family protein [Verrucomicrobia bacterium]|nr:SMI1/KNR4 family protein [Verrucomicrobiota bacterium]
MNSSLHRLITIEPPPIHLVAPGSLADWSRVETEVGARLPQDFKDYISVYGAGQWGDFFGVINPFYKWKHPQAQESWRAWMDLRLGGLEEMGRKYPQYTAPFRPHPASDGLLAFGYNDNGGTLCWQASGEPDSWRIVCLDGKLSEEYDAFDMTLTAFLAALLSEEISLRTFAPDFFPVRRPAFRPYTTE